MENTAGRNTNSMTDSTGTDTKSKPHKDSRLLILVFEAKDLIANLRIATGKAHINGKYPWQNPGYLPLNISVERISRQFPESSSA